MPALSCTGPYIKSCKSPLDGDEIRAIMLYDGYAMEKTNVFFYFRLCKLCDDVI